MIEREGGGTVRLEPRPVLSRPLPFPLLLPLPCLPLLALSLPGLVIYIYIYIIYISFPSLLSAGVALRPRSLSRRLPRASSRDCAAAAGGSPHPAPRRRPIRVSVLSRPASLHWVYFHTNINILCGSGCWWRGGPRAGRTLWCCTRTSCSPPGTEYYYYYYIINIIINLIIIIIIIIIIIL